MIQSIKLRNFRNFDNFSLENLTEKNFIVGENGKGKTNILESISLLCNNSINSLSFDDLIHQNSDVFYIEFQNNLGDTLALSYEKENKKKKYILNGKNVAKNKFKTHSFKTVIFAPIMMNMMYLSPSLRRDFMDTILLNCYPEFEDLLKDYKKLVRHRNKILKNIAEQKSQNDEINYWNDEFIKKAIEIYHYRFSLVSYFEKHISPCLQYFGGKVQDIQFSYQTKVSPETIEEDMRKYLEDNLQRDIILAKTAIGPHVDDFDILVDGKSLIGYASRGETKSVIIWMKLLETVYIEKRTGSKPILIIDDLFSELDESHEHMILEKIKYYQTFISSIQETDEGNLIKL